MNRERIKEFVKAFEKKVPIPLPADLRYEWWITCMEAFQVKMDTAVWPKV